VEKVIDEFPELGGEYKMALSRDERAVYHLLLTGEDVELVRSLELLHKALMTCGEPYMRLRLPTKDVRQVQTRRGQKIKS
jgi:hypothetical protein